MKMKKMGGSHSMPKQRPAKAKLVMKTKGMKTPSGKSLLSSKKSKLLPKQKKLKY